jgi:hypothetical protein
VPSGDEEAFATALSKLAADRQLQKELGARGLEFVERAYPKERLIEDIKKLYEQLIKVEPISDCELRNCGIAEFTEWKNSSVN